MVSFTNEIQKLYPGIFVHSVCIGGSEREDRLSALWDDVNRQIDELCAQLAKVPELRSGFDAIGFSQGGQFLRAYVQRCNNPPVRNLITLGAQHQGIMRFPLCAGEGDEESGGCRLWKRLTSTGIYSDFAQSHIVPAQYYKDPHRLDEYKRQNRFLADINNEGEFKNPDYARNLASLQNFVMYMFEADTTVVPRQSSWFGFHDGKRVVSLRQQSLYAEDWIGLRTLDEEGRLHFLSIPAGHMQLPRDFVARHLAPWLGGHADDNRQQMDILRPAKKGPKE